MPAVPAVAPAAAPPGASFRALQLIDRLPMWAVVHAQQDSSAAPLIQAGEIAVVDTRPGWGPESLVLVEFGQSQRLGLRTRSIRQIGSREILTPTGPAGLVATPALPAARRTRGPRLGRIADIGDRVVGEVIGIYGPSIAGRC